MADVKRVSATAAAAYCDIDSRRSCGSIHVLTSVMISFIRAWLNFFMTKFYLFSIGFFVNNSNMR